MSNEQISFESLYERHYSEILRFCFWKMRNQQDAEKLAHEAFVKAYLKWEKFDPARGSFRAPRTASGLSFEALKKYAEGDFDATQQQHVMACTHCQAMARLFAKHLRVTEVPERAKPQASLIGITDWITAMADWIGEKLFLEGMEHYNKEKYDRALELLKRAVTLDSTD